MFDPVPAHIKLIQRDHILREVIPDAVIRSKLTGNRIFGCKQIGNLNIQLFSALIANKVNLPVPGSADRDLIASAKQFQINNVLKDQVDVPCVAAISIITEIPGNYQKFLKSPKEES